MEQKRRYAFVAIVFYGLFTWGCGGGKTSVNVSEFTEQHAQLFEDSVDFVTDPALLEAQLAKQWETDFDARYNLSDFIGVVTVTTVVNDVNLERRSTIRMQVSVVKDLRASAPDDFLSLGVSEEAPGYARIEKNQQRILNQRYVAYVKWYKLDNGEVDARWHLSPASDTIVSRLDKLIAEDRAKKKVVRVVVNKE